MTLHHFLRDDLTVTLRSERHGLILAGFRCLDHIVSRTDLKDSVEGEDRSRWWGTLQVRHGKDIPWMQEVITGMQSCKDVSAELGSRTRLKKRDGFARGCWQSRQDGRRCWQERLQLRGRCGCRCRGSGCTSSKRSSGDCCYTAGSCIESRCSYAAQQGRG